MFLAECLLKRTTSTAALEAYNRLVLKYPDVFALASARSIEGDLRRVGLYRQRGRLIIQAAEYIANELEGIFPHEPSELERIPGIGKYTASAIASFAFGIPVPAVDSNVVRVLMRFLGETSLDTSGASLFLEESTRRKSSRRFNFAMIDLGSMVCRPANPRCETCPLKQRCVYRDRKSTGKVA